MPDVSVSPFSKDPQPPQTEMRGRFDGREFVRDVLGRWRDDYGNEIKLDANGDMILDSKGEPTIERSKRPTYTTHSLSRWQDRHIEDPAWFLDQWIPIGEIFSLYGRPGSRKSTLLLQWMIAACLGKRFGNVEQPLAYGPCYGLFCEDNERTIARRARAILDHYGASFRDMRDCHAESLVDAHMTEFVSFRRSGIMDTTPAWDKFLSDLDVIKPVFVCLDVVPDFFGGDEIRRRESSQFLRLLDKTAEQRQFALAFSAHPSVRGIKDRSLNSGNTGWEGKVRGRGTLEDPSDRERDNDDNDPIFNQSDRRTLTLVKTNYAKNGASMDFVVRNGVFIPADLDPETQKKRANGPAEQAADERKFLDRLRDAIDAGTPLNNNREHSAYAPTALIATDFTFKQAEAAFKRLVASKRLKCNMNKRGPERWTFLNPATEN